MYKAAMLFILIVPMCPAEAGRKVLLGGMPVNTIYANGGGDYMKIMLLNPSSKPQTVTLKVKTTGSTKYSVPVAIPPTGTIAAVTNSPTSVGVKCEDEIIEKNSFLTQGYRSCKYTTTIQPESSAFIVFGFSVACLNQNICTNPYRDETAGVGTALGELSVSSR